MNKDRAAEILEFLADHVRETGDCQVTFADKSGDRTLTVEVKISDYENVH